MSKSSEEILRLLLLYDSGELGAGEKARVDRALAESDALRAELEKVRALQRELKKAASFEPSAEMMNDLRHDLRVQLRRERLRPTWQEKLEAWLSGGQPVWQIAAAAALIIVGIVVDRAFLTKPPRQNGAAELLQLFAAAQPVAAENGSVSPLMAGVEYIRIDPQTDQVEIHFSLVNDIQLRGRPDDPMIKRVLARALMENDRPNVRLKAVKALAGLPGQGQALAAQPIVDDDLITALVHVLRNDDNEGIRLKAAQVLRHLPVNDKIKTALSWALLRESNTAIRLEALDALGTAPLGEEEVATLQAAVADTNDYVSLRAKRLIERRENTVQREQITTEQSKTKE